jgi:RNA polymerase sigma factor (sigma-70 family)
MEWRRMAGRRSGDVFKHLSSLFRVGTLAGVPDAQLLERFVAGRDEAGEMAFGALVERHGPMVLRVCQSVLGHRHDAEDAFQVTFLILARKAGSIRKQRFLGSWLHGVAYRVALRAQTASRRRLARETKAAKGAEMTAPCAEPVEDELDLTAALHQEITRLPAKYRAPIVLCYLEGMTHDQAASELGWPVGTVRGRLARARDLLRNRLTHRGLTLSAGLVSAGSLPETGSAALTAALVEATVRAALGSTAAGVLSRTAALLLQAVIRNMALVRSVKLAEPVLMIAVVAGTAAMFAHSGGTKLSRERTSIAKIKLLPAPAPTDPAGDPLPAGARARLGTTRFLNAASPTQIAYSPDGATLASFDGASYLWDVATGQEIRRIGMGKMRINEAVLAPDGKSVATGATDKTIRLWDLATGREVRRFAGGDNEPGHLAFSPDGTKLASTERTIISSEFWTSPPLTPVHVWDTARGRELRHWETDNDSRICFSPDRTTLASVGSGQVIRLWELASPREIRPQTGSHHSAIADAAFIPDGRSIVTVGQDRTVRFWDPATGKEVCQLEGSSASLGFASFSADGKSLATGYGSQPTRLWDVASGRELRQFQMPCKRDDQFVSCADLSPDGKTLATSADDGVTFWDTATGEWKVSVAKSRLAPTRVTTLVKALRFAPDGESVATIGGHWGRIWNVATAKETRRIVMPNAPPWRPGAPPRPALDVVGSGAYLAFSPEGKVLAASSQQDGQICLLDMASGKEIARLDGPSGLKALAFSPDGNILATSIETSGKHARDRSIRLWDVAARRDLCRVKAHRSGISTLAFSPDGRRLLSASADATALVWDVAALTGRTSTPAADRRGEGVRKE